jgi:hypothetical protein
MFVDQARHPKKSRNHLKKFLFRKNRAAKLIVFELDEDGSSTG